MFVVDTNVLVYAADIAAMQHEACRAGLEAWRRQFEPWFLTWNVAYEFVRVTTHSRVLRQPWRVAQAWSFLKALDASPGLRWLDHTPAHLEVGTSCLERAQEIRGNLVFDLHTVNLMREHGLRRIVSYDRDFERFPDIEVVTPKRAMTSRA